MKKLTFALLLLTAWRLEAQEPAAPAATPEPMPPGPAVITKLPDFAEWVITITPAAQPPKPGRPANATPPPAPTPQTLVFTKTKPILRMQTMNGSTVVEDRWIVGAVQVVTAPNMRFPYVFRSNGAVASGDYGKSDFPELSWISEARFDSVMMDKTSKRKALIFKDILQTKAADGVLSVNGVVAAVDFESRLPIYLRDVLSTRTYQVKSPPSAMQTIPPAVQETLDREVKNNAVLNRPAGRP